MNDPTILILSAISGVCVFAGVLLARDGGGRFLDYVQADLEQRFRKLRIRVPRIRAWIYSWIGISLAVFIAITLAGDAPVLALLLAVLLLCLPWYLIRRQAIRRHRKIEDQLADAMVMFSSAIRAGLSMAQSLELLAKECPRPIHQEFQQIVNEYKLGKTLERTLTEAKERLKSENFLIFAAALLASRESGGRLNETVERISQSVLELQRLERKVQSETAQARKSAVYMALVPPLMLVVYAFVDPVNLRLLFVSLPGQLILAAAVILNLVAYFWSLKILKARL